MNGEPDPHAATRQGAARSRGAAAARQAAARSRRRGTRRPRPSSGTVALVVVLALTLATAWPWEVGRTVDLLWRRRGEAVAAPSYSLPDTCRTSHAVSNRASAPVGRPALSPTQIRGEYRSATSLPGQWIDLTSLDWESATSGWQPLADAQAPKRDQAFPYGPLRVNGRDFERGIGTYPLSEIVYTLGGEYTALRALVGIDDSAPERGSARFSVYGDDVLLYRSPTLLHGDQPITIEVPLLGAQLMRLTVDDVDDGSTGDYADWLAPQLLRPTAGAAALSAGRSKLAELQRQAIPPPISAQRALVDALQSQAFDERLDFVGAAGKASLWFDPAQCRLVLVNGETRASFGYGGEDHGELAFAQVHGAGMAGAFSDLLLPGGPLSLRETRPLPLNPWALLPVDDVGLGSGARLVIHLEAPSEDPLAVEIAIYEDPVALTYRIQPGPPLGATGFAYFGERARAVVGQQPRFLSERGQLWRGAVPADALERKVPLGPSKPLLVWSNETKNGLLMATIDVSEAPLAVRLRPMGGPEVGLDVTMGFLPIEQNRSFPVGSPRLWIQPVRADHFLNTFAGYQAVMARLYPPAPLPEWVRFQWNSWWTYGPTPTDQGVRREIDYIAANLADLGPWNVAIDAAWYVAYGAPGSDLRSVDYQKFPNGIRAVTNYAHERGVKAIMFMPAGFVHSGQSEGGEWLALQTLIDEHPDWLIPVLSSGASAYILNYAHPGVRAHVEAVVTDIVREHGADGIMLDGLADPEGQFIGVRPRDTSATEARYLPATAIYRLVGDRLRALKPDAYLEGGWINPAFAHPYAHTFWWSDDWPEFDNPYPFGGLRQHIDYSLFQWVALGQRAKMGTVWGDPNSRQVQRWIEAAVALGTQVSLSFDLAGLDPDRLSALRSRLTHYHAFEGRTVTSSRVRPNAFATTVGHMTYLGVLNRTSRARAYESEIGELGVLAPGLMAFDVEREHWTRATDIGSREIPAKSFRLFIVAHQPQIVWSNASWAYAPSDDARLVATLRGPMQLKGFAQVWAPGTKRVLLDGATLEQGATPGPGRYSYDAADGVVGVEIAFDGRPQRLEVRW